jgi:hypothetical protein
MSFAGRRHLLLVTALAACAACGGSSFSAMTDAGASSDNDAGPLRGDAGMIAPSDAAPPRDAATSGTIALSLVTESTGQPWVTAQVSVGGSPPFTAIFDTGSVGLRVLDGTLPAGAFTKSSTPASVTYGSGVVATGVVATAVVTVGGFATPQAIAIEDITSVACDTTHPNCEAKGKTLQSFRFGDSFAAMLGVGLRASAATNIASPLSTMGAHHRYLLALPPYGGTSGSATLDPSMAETDRFETVVQLPSFGATTPSGVLAWDDTQVPFCVNAFCDKGLLDTGAPTTLSPASADDYTAIGVADNATSVPTGEKVTIAIDTTASWSFTVGSAPMDGLDQINLVSGHINNLGVMPFHQFDVLYDYTAGKVALNAKP